MILEANHPLDEIVQAQKQGESRGITSVCSAHPTILEAVFHHALQNEILVLIESTCNQVNQYGGYTGMKPVDFVTYVNNLAGKVGFPLEKLILGGDHLGPNVWQHEPAESAMAKSYQLIRDYITAGYCKIHLDASMKLGDDPEGPLSAETITRRAAGMAQVAEQSFIENGQDIAPRYVIGTEVPIPGGTQEEDDPLRVTDVQDTRETLEMTQQAFYDLGLETAWERVIAVVVQPGVEYGNDLVMDYDRSLTIELSNFIKDQSVIYEAHSTDYQLPIALRQLVEDHFAILKVGPALTFAFREAIFGLAWIENELFPTQDCSNIIEVLDQTMLGQPKYWENHYRGSANAQANARKYSFSDRSRYYWPVNDVQTAVQKLIRNLEKKVIPLTMLSQYLPEQYENIRSGITPNDYCDIIQDKLFRLLDVYRVATKP